MASRHSSIRVIGLLGVGILLVLLIGIIRPGRLAPRNEPGIQSDFDGREPEVDESKAAAAHFVNRVRRPVPSVSTETNAAERRKEVRARFMVSQERVQQLMQIGVYPLPILGGLKGSQASMLYTSEQVIEMFPYLRSEDGAVDWASVERLKSLLNDLNGIDYERKGYLQGLPAASQEGAAGNLPLELDSSGKMLEISSFVASLQPKMRVYPSPELLSLSPGYVRYDTHLMQQFMNRVAEVQTWNDRGKPREQLRKLVQQFMPAPNPRLTDEQADRLIETPINRLAWSVKQTSP